MCGGTGTDVDGDGICDDADNCADLGACNYNDPANVACAQLDECGVCGGSGIPAGDCDCFGNQGTPVACAAATARIRDATGVCDERRQLYRPHGLQLQRPGNTVLVLLDECGVCGGCGIADGAVTARQPRPDALGVCGGTCAADSDGMDV